MDYEKAIWNAARATWENVTLRGCWFHFNQCIYKKVSDLKLDKSYLTHEPTRKMVRRLMTLPLMDHANIGILFELLKEKYHEQINDPNSTKVRDLFAYFEKQWIQGTNFSPEEYSCFMKIIRTNNQIEHWNGYIYREGGSKAHNIYLLAQLLGQDASKAMLNFEQYAAKVYVKRSQAEKDTAVKEAYRLYNFHKNSWRAMEDLRVATTKHCAFTLGDDPENSLIVYYTCMCIY